MHPENLPISPEIWKELEQHLQEWFIHHWWELPGKIRETQERVRLQGELPGASQGECKHVPSRTIPFTGESSTDAQKVGQWLRQDLGMAQWASWGMSWQMSPVAQEAP